MTGFNLLESLRLRLGLSVYVGHRRLPDWRAAIPFYAWVCPRHGLVESYPQGHGGALRCPRCLEEAVEVGQG